MRLKNVGVNNVFVPISVRRPSIAANQRGRACRLDRRKAARLLLGNGRQPKRDGITQSARTEISNSRWIVSLNQSERQ
jgi:hypothetical protein